MTGMDEFEEEFMHVEDPSGWSFGEYEPEDAVKVGRSILAGVLAAMPDMVRILNDGLPPLAVYQFETGTTIEFTIQGPHHVHLCVKTPMDMGPFIEVVDE